jgi:hypothetical protein
MKLIKETPGILTQNQINDIEQSVKAYTKKITELKEVHYIFL